MKQLLIVKRKPLTVRCEEAGGEGRAGIWTCRMRLDPKREGKSDLGVSIIRQVVRQGERYHLEGAVRPLAIGVQEVGFSALRLSGENDDWRFHCQVIRGSGGSVLRQRGTRYGLMKYHGLANGEEGADRLRPRLELEIGEGGLTARVTWLAEPYATYAFEYGGRRWTCIPQEKDHVVGRDGELLAATLWRPGGDRTVSVFFGGTPTSVYPSGRGIGVSIRLVGFARPKAGESGPAIAGNLLEKEQVRFID